MFRCIHGSFGSGRNLSISFSPGSAVVMAMDVMNLRKEGKKDSNLLETCVSYTLYVKILWRFHGAILVLLILYMGITKGCSEL